LHEQFSGKCTALFPKAQSFLADKQNPTYDAIRVCCDADGKTISLRAPADACCIEGTNVLSIGSTGNFNISLILAQQQVRTDQARVEQSSAQLRRDQAQLNADLKKLAAVQQQAARAAQVDGRLAQRDGLFKLEEKAAAAQPKIEPVPQPASTSQAQVNTNGQTVGQVIDIVA
jgi:uncharacterized membrane-anchored protein